jgi:F-box protein 18 (helicase)
MSEQRIYLNISFDQKDKAKEEAYNAGTRLIFDFHGTRKWYIQGTSVPDALKKYPIISQSQIPNKLPQPPPDTSTPAAKTIIQPKILTEEQQNCVKTEPQPGETIRWMAFAGTGKTTTLVAYTFARPLKRFLYLAFNRTVAEQGRQRFNRNTDCMTIHALAYRWLPNDLRIKLTPDIKPYQIAKALNLQFGRRSDRETAALVRETLLDFFSTAKTPEPNKDNLPAKTPFGQEENILNHAKSLWSRMKDPQETEVKITHDAYLKMYALAKPSLEHYNYILLDEAQDTNPVTEEIILNQTAPKILVGDTAQGIYTFRKAENSIEKIEQHPSYKGHTLFLTQSFRFGNHIANLANHILHHFKGETNRLKGLNPNKGAIYPSNAKPWEISTMKSKALALNQTSHTVIARTNASIFIEAFNTASNIDLWEKQTPQTDGSRLTIGFVGTTPADNFSPMANYKFATLLDIYHLYANKKDMISNPYIRAFPDFKAIEDAAANDTHPDQELAGPVKLVKHYRNEIPSMITTIINRCGNPESPTCYARYTTAHKAKGLEWRRVKLTDDYTQLILHERKQYFPKNPELNHYPRLATTYDTPADEFHLLYMAVTRTEVDLQINGTLETFIHHIQSPENQDP